MDKLLVRTASAIGLVSLAMLIVGLTPFLAAGPSAGAGFTSKTPEAAVNRSLKGDRLPGVDSGLYRPQTSGAAAGSDEPQSRRRSGRQPQIPLGCEAAFSPVSSPSLAYIYRRCMT